MLKFRTLTTAVFLIVFFLGLFHRSFWWILPILLVVAVLISLHEFVHFGGLKPAPPYQYLASMGSIALLADAYFFKLEHALIILGLLPVIMLAVGTFRVDRNFTEAAGKCLIATLYCSLPLALITDIWQKAVHAQYENGHQNGQHYIIFLVLVTQAADIGAYLTGRMVGKHKFAPRLSPGKTWEGFGGGIVFSIALAFCMYFFWNNISRIFQLWEVVVLAVIFAVVGPVGDLAESLLKRSAGVKDSGRTGTGMGGMLDIIDSLLFTTIFYYIWLWFLHPDIVRHL
jgi:phosphatidate cytidylyltransferase